MVKRLLLSFFLLLASSFSFSESNEVDYLLRRIKSRSSFTEHSSERREISPIYIGPQDGLMQLDKINALPGQPTGINFDQYAGYVTVDPMAGRALFYYFVESPHNSSTNPLILWLNGGPGCSSFGNGAMTELGPFRVNSDGKTLFQNKYAWNNVANVIFLESPAGVGFSYSNTSSDYDRAGDKSTAIDAYTFLVNWLERFPQYKSRDFYITGESYAGHYVPQLADTILFYNKITTKQSVINLKGIAIGNGLLNDYTDALGSIDYMWTHALISDESYKGIRVYCDFVNGTNSEQCDNYVEQANKEIGNIDYYNIYAPLCHSDVAQNKGSTGSVVTFDPCSELYVKSYLNTAEVQTALHVNLINWNGCSGDVDSVVPVTSSRYSISSLNLPIKTPWYPWYTNKEVGGYAVEYKGVTFVTVRGAGHLVPSYQPAPALTMISSFLEGNGEANQQADFLDGLLKSKRSKNNPQPQPHLWAEAELENKQEYFSGVFMGDQDGLMEADKIYKLPGQPDDGVDFNQYSGYVTVDPNEGKALFYYFVESPHNSSTNPLLLWLNGGPGCSSFGYGAMSELGPFRVNSDGKTLFRNNFAWTNVANVIFLESPAGVGFSYSNSTSSSVYSHTGDKSTAEDAYTFLVNWLERFPQYKNRDFFIAGESYAGHYVPQLAFTIILNNDKYYSNRTINNINLKGIAIGNAWIDDATNTAGQVDYLWNIRTYCDFNQENSSQLCTDKYLKIFVEAGNIDFFHIYAAICLNTSLNNGGPPGSVHDYNPCSDYYVKSYLNLPQVQTALHVKSTKWSPCSVFNWTDSPTTILPIIKTLMASDIRLWIYSGDVDGRVPITSSKYSINSLNLPIKTHWYPWNTNDEVGGYAVRYEGLTLVTVRGAGHLVPSYQPERSLTMISSFLEEILPPPQPN
ncbi:hypothetical protein ACOSQ4_016048 [Xanthoceras sorbifolium]